MVLWSWCLPGVSRSSFDVGGPQPYTPLQPPAEALEGGGVGPREWRQRTVKSSDSDRGWSGCSRVAYIQYCPGSSGTLAYPGAAGDPPWITSGTTFCAPGASSRCVITVMQPQPPPPGYTT